MGIMLGNLSVAQIESRLGISLTENDRKRLNEARQERVNGTPLAKGKWHCFDIPFMLVCDTMETLSWVRDILTGYELHGSIQIGCEK